MSSGAYGNTIPASFIPAQHAEVWLSYQQDRNTTGEGFALVETTKFIEYEVDQSGNQINGLYRLKMPIDVFNRVGIYNIYIRPKQIETTIQDVGVLASYPDIRGVILNSDLIEGTTSNDSLVGFMVEYYDQSGLKIPNMFRIITSNNRCEPTNQTNGGLMGYRFNDNSNLIFLTLTPSSSSNTRPSVLPYIGSMQDRIILSNTFFNPEMIEIELTENDIESLFTSINGNQIRNLENNILTTYDKNNNIVNQSEHFIIKETETGNPLFDVKVNKKEIDFTQSYDQIIGLVE